MKPLVTIEIGAHRFMPATLSGQQFSELLQDLLLRMGIRGDVQVTVTSNPVLLHINGMPAGYSFLLIDQVTEYIEQVPGGMQLNARVFWQTFISEVLWRQPDLLVTGAVATALLPALPTEEGIAILCDLLQSGIALPEAGRLSDLITQHTALTVGDTHQLRESLITVLGNRNVAVHIHPEYYKNVIRDGTDYNFFSSARTALIQNIGVDLLSFDLQFDESLPLQCFYFAVNDLVSIPCTGLASNDERLVNDAATNLASHGITARKKTSPTDSLQVSVIDIGQAERVTENKFDVFTPTLFFEICLQTFLNQHARCFINTEWLTRYMDENKSAYAEVAGFVASPAQTALLAQVARLLAAEQVTIKPIYTIAEAVLEADCVVANEAAFNIIDERTPVMEAPTAGWKQQAKKILPFVRQKIYRALLSKYAVSSFKLFVYSLDVEIEQTILQYTQIEKFPEAAIIQLIRTAIENELSGLPPGAQKPIVMTRSVAARAVVQQIIAPSLPNVGVFSFKEFGTRFTPELLANISLAAVTGNNHDDSGDKDADNVQHNNR